MPRKIERDEYQKTTADYLSALRTELVAGGFESHEAFELIRPFAAMLAEEGFSVHEGGVLAA